MKLIYCPKCKSITSLTTEPISCRCGKSSGVYVDEVNAEISGFAIPLGIGNNKLAYALSQRPFAGRGWNFSAFVIPHVCSSVKEVECLDHDTS